MDPCVQTSIEKAANGHLLSATLLTTCCGSAMAQSLSPNGRGGYRKRSWDGQCFEMSPKVQTSNKLATLGLHYRLVEVLPSPHPSLLSP